MRCGLGEVRAPGLISGLDGQLRHGLLVFDHPVHAEMPFADSGGVVALRLKHRCYRETTWLDQMRA